MVKLNKQKIIDKYVGTVINILLTPFKNIKNWGYMNETIIIYKLDAIGDTVLSLPMIKHLKRETNARIVVACSASNQMIFKGHKFIDRIVVFDSSKLNIKDLIKNIKELKKEYANFSIDTAQSSNISAIMSFLTSRITIGFKKTRGRSRNLVYNKSIELNPNKHMIFNYFDLIAQLGIKYPKKIGLVKLQHKKTKYKDSIIIHPCTIIPQKVWPQYKWIEIIEYLTKNYKLILIGSKEETPLVNGLLKDVDKRFKKKITNLAGEIELNELINIMNKSKLFIGMDGGPAHISAAMGINTIALFGYESPTRYSPFSKKSISIYKDMPCSPCIKAYKNQWPDCTNPLCMKLIRTDEVIKAINKLLK